MRLLNKLKIACITFGGLMILGSIQTKAVTGIITEGTVNVREKTDTSSKKIAYVFKNDKVEVLEKDGSWYKVKLNGKTGYIYSKYVKVDESALSVQTSEQEANAEVTKDVETKLTLKGDVKVRLVPNPFSTVITSGSSTTKFTILKQMDTWTYVSMNGITGWMNTDQIVEESITKSEDDMQSNQAETESSSSNNQTQKTTSKKAYVKYSTINLREKASTSSKILAKLKLNDEVSILEKINNVWVKVSADGKTGYVSQDLLANKKQTTSSKQKASATTSRSGEASARENTQNETIEQSKTETVQKIDSKNDKNQTEEKKKVAEQKEQTSSNSSSTETKKTNQVTGEDIVSYAKQYLGYQYVYGAASPSKGFDCSGLVYYVYKHFGYTLARSSSGQANNGVKVEKKDLQPGDILIYKNTSLTKIGHVGIYIGNNKMIHASEPGVGVIITDIDAKSHKYPERYVMARRILK